MSEILNELQEWFAQNCDDDWEHLFGIKISTLDNPGWYVEIDTAETMTEISDFDWEKINHSDTDWVHFKVENGKFCAACGTRNLMELLGTFFRLTKEARHR